jgi:hypothetical protein
MIIKVNKIKLIFKIKNVFKKKKIFFKSRWLTEKMKFFFF